MKTLELGKYRQARIWFEDHPDAAYLSVKTFRHTIMADRVVQNGAREAAIEVVVPLGARSMYGLLGGKWIPNTSGQLSIEINISSANERLLADSLAKGDQVHVGLLAEYVEAVVWGVDLAKRELGTLASGKLSINYAAHGAIGSCGAVYKHLAAILVKLFNATTIEQSDEELLKLFPAKFD